MYVIRYRIYQKHNIFTLPDDLLKQHFVRIHFY